RRGAAPPPEAEGEEGVGPVALQRGVGVPHAEDHPPRGAESRFLLQLATRSRFGRLAGIHDAPGDLQRVGIDARPVLPHHHRLPRRGEGDHGDPVGAVDADPRVPASVRILHLVLTDAQDGVVVLLAAPQGAPPAAQFSSSSRWRSAWAVISSWIWSGASGESLRQRSTSASAARYAPSAERMVARARSSPGWSGCRWRRRSTARAARSPSVRSSHARFTLLSIRQAITFTGAAESSLGWN